MSRLVARAIVIASVGLGLSWLLLADTSPLSSWLLTHAMPTNIAMAANFVPFVLAAVASGNVHAPDLGWLVGFMLAWWALVGLLLSWLFARLWPNNSSKPTPLRGAA